MPHTTRWTNNRFFADFHGEVTAAEIEAVNQEFTGDLRFDSVRYALWDMTAITQLNMSDADVEYAAATDSGAATVRPKLRGAMVVPQAHVRTLVDQYLKVSDELGSPWETRVFDTVAEATAWLEST